MPCGRLSVVLQCSLNTVKWTVKRCIRCQKKNPGFHSSAIDLVIELRQVTSNRPQVTYRPNGDTILDNNMDVSGSPCL